MKGYASQLVRPHSRLARSTNTHSSCSVIASISRAVLPVANQHNVGTSVNAVMSTACNNSLPTNRIGRLAVGHQRVS